MLVSDAKCIFRLTFYFVVASCQEFLHFAFAVVVVACFSSSNILSN